MRSGAVAQEVPAVEEALGQTRIEEMTGEGSGGARETLVREIARRGSDNAEE